MRLGSLSVFFSTSLQAHRVPSMRARPLQMPVDTWPTVSVGQLQTACRHAPPTPLLSLLQPQPSKSVSSWAGQPLSSLACYIWPSTAYFWALFKVLFLAMSPMPQSYRDLPVLCAFPQAEAISCSYTSVPLSCWSNLCQNIPETLLHEHAS